METYPIASWYPVFVTCFSQVEDPRIERSKRHQLLDIFGLTIAAVLAGANGWTDVEAFGKAKLDWLRTHFELKNGIPSHDTLGRVFGALDPAMFQQAFMEWTQALADQVEGVVSVDGKTVRRSHDESAGQGAIHMISAWANGNQVVLAQSKVEDKSNEITAIPELIERLDLKDCVVTIDAMGCQTNIARRIVEREADYVLAVKANQPHLLDEVERHFTDTPESAMDYHCTQENSHGRRETRQCWVSTDVAEDPAVWSALTAFVMVRATREIKGKTTTETRYYITSVHNPAAEQILAYVRAHWGIENSLHWVLDVTFNEDQCRVRTQNAAQNFTILRHIALNTLKRDTKHKDSIRAKRRRAAWNTDYLEYLLTLLGGEN